MNHATLSILSIDPSLRATGVYYANGADRKVWVVKTGKMERVAALSKLKDACSSIAREYPADIGVVEGYAYGAHSRSMTTMGEAGGIIRVILYEHTKYLFEIAPVAWKGIAIGKEHKKTTKAQIVEYLRLVEEKYHVKFDSADIADAYMMARIVKSMIAGKWTTKTAIMVRKRVQEVFG